MGLRNWLTEEAREAGWVEIVEIQGVLDNQEMLEIQVDKEKPLQQKSQ